ncbi:MAG TPA: coproporphyrinogen-III oxidase family protein [Blastocatellia bacterium]|nr:coproporphyrinogen-III oxidase family protein [Blastocatellia bacterium]
MQPDQIVASPDLGQRTGDPSPSVGDIFREISDRVESETNKDLLIYVHVPFCTTKCTFCDWVTDISVTQLRSESSVRKRYVDALCAQISTLGRRLVAIGYTAKYIYWGGGTPSRLESVELAEIMAALRDSIDLSQVQEHTMETSPETLSLAKLQMIRSLGVNRVSMGVQSFDDAELKRAARGHSASQAEDAFHMIRQAGIGNVNLDLIVAFPDQQLESVRKSIAKTIELGPDHVTVYIYRPEPETVMARQIASGHRAGCSSKDIFEFYNLAASLLEAAGYHEYSVGYFVKDLKNRFLGEEYYYAMKGDYVGFGSGATSILGHHKLRNVAGNLHRFIEHPSEFDSCERFSPANLEIALPMLRTTLLTEIGIDFKNFRRLFGFDFSAVSDHPFLKTLISYYKFCGTSFVQTNEGLRTSEDTRRNSYITSLSRAYSLPRGRGSDTQKAAPDSH